jgi:hypothetical protein
LLAEFQNRRQGYLPQWNPPAKSAGAAMGPVFASILSAVLERLNQAPGKEKLAFLDLLGLRLVPAQPARAPIVFTLTQGASDTSAPEGTQVAAPPPPGSSQQIVFSTEEDAAVSAASLSEVISLWPGRDQFIDHSAAFAADQSFTLFQDLQLQPTDHILYLAHSQYLAFAGSANLKVVFDLAQPSSTALEIIWEYWDGQVWRGFLPNEASCLNPVSDGEDGTSGLARSGSVQLVVQGAQAVQTAVNGVNSYWIRARLGQPLLPDPNQILPEIDSIRLVTVIEQDFEALLACSFAAPSVTKIFVMSSGNSPTPGATIQVTNTSDSHFPFTATTDATGLVAIPVPFTVGGEYTLAVMDSTGATIYESSYTALAPFANLVLSDSASPEVSPLTLLTLATGGGTPLAKVQVTITDSSANLVTSGATDSNGNLTVPQSTQLDVGTTYTFTATWSGRQAKGCAIYTGTPVFEIDLTFSLQALRADKAYSDGKSLDVTKAFQPLGPMPQPGSVFYFKSAEAFSKPGATVQVFADAIWAGSPTSGATPFAHLVLWEYWNGFDWMPLLSSGPGTDFTSPQIIQFVVPQDMLSTKVNNDDGLWVRVRVAWGRFGYQQTLTLPSTSIPPSVTFPVIQAPVLSDFRISYNWQNGPFALEQVFTCNDFQYADQTANARWPGTPFAPYGLIGDVTPAFYLGFSGQLPVNNFGVYFDIAEQAGVTAGPAMAWEYWNGGEWTPAVVSEDDTVNLALPGIITFIPAADAQSLARFDKPLYWLRGRLKEDGPPDETAINSIDTNAVWASQWQMYSNSPLGTSTGVPSQIFRFNQVPILPGQEIEIQELSGPRANTEWRNLATQAAPGDPEIIDELEAMLAAEGPQTDILLGSIHLVRDRTKSVTAVWIQWQERQNFFAAGSSDRIYVLDHALGRMFFGDGDAGMIPSAGALIQATSFRSGGGLAGNVQAGVITQLLGSVTGVQGVTNPRAAEGGADGETPRQFQQRAPCSLRNRGRAIAPEDYEALAQQASAGVAVARAFPTLDPSGISRPGWVTVMIIPQSQDPRPAPSAGLRDDVLKYLLACAPADIAAAGAITVVGPVYLPVDVVTTLAPVDPATAGTVEQAALDALAGFLNPLTGGPGGLGWDVGRGLYASDISGVLGNVGGVDYVQDLGLYVNGVLQGEQVQVPTGQIVVAGQLEVSLVLPVGS